MGFMLRCFLLLWALVFSSDAVSATSKDPMVVKLYGGGFSESLRPYLKDVVQLLMESTVAEFGSYKIQVRGEQLSVLRAQKETQRGHRINAIFAVGWEPEDKRQHNVVSLPIPLFNNLLGLRELLVSNTSPLKMVPSSQPEFLRYRAGQGEGWGDVEILQSNQVDVVTSPSFDALFPMLDKRRFDYLPLSVLEIDEVWQHYHKSYPGLQIMHGIYIFYPMVVALNVNAKEEALIQRLRLGILKSASKTLPELYDRHFPKLRLKQGGKKALFLAKNPMIDPVIHQQIQSLFF